MRTNRTRLPAGARLCRILVQSAGVTPVRSSPLFVTTQWSAVLCAGGEDSPAVQEALAQLCATYWYPIYAHVRRRGFGPDDAADFTQEFFMVLLRRNSLSQVTREKGRFRTFLLASLDYSLHDQLSRQRAAKRGGGLILVSLDSLSGEQRLALEPATDETPDRAFDRRWAVALMEKVMMRLGSEQAGLGREDLFLRLRPLLTREVEPGEYDQLSTETGHPPNSIAKRVQRLRFRARQIMREEAAHTVAAPADVEQELWDLFR